MNCASSVFLGLFFTLLLFAVCFFLVVGVKFFALTVRSSAKPPEPEPTKPEPPKPPRKPRRKYKTIEINPDEVDRIYVKK